MAITSHGGGCCGVKHIDYIQNHPDTLCSKYSPQYVIGKSYPPRPSEKTSERWKADIAWVKDQFKDHLFITTLASVRLCQPGKAEVKSQIALWEPILLAEGFVLACESKNSNTGNTIRTYMLNWKDREIVPLLPKVKEKVDV